MTAQNDKTVIERDAKSTTPKVGKWTEVYDESQPLFFRRYYVCSVCGASNTYGMPPYCMYCGSKMEKK